MVREGHHVGPGLGGTQRFLVRRSAGGPHLPAGHFRLALDPASIPYQELARIIHEGRVNNRACLTNSHSRLQRGNV